MAETHDLIKHIFVPKIIGETIRGEDKNIIRLDGKGEDASILWECCRAGTKLDGSVKLVKDSEW